MPPSRQKSKRRPTIEYCWAQDNQGQIDHVAFFDKFISLSRKNIVNRFNNLTKNCIPDEEKEEEVQDNYKSWQKSPESKKYWMEREVRHKQFIEQYVGESSSVVSRSTSPSSSNTSTTSSAVDMASGTVKDLLKSNLVPINNEDKFIINSINITQKFRDFQSSLLRDSLSLTYQSHTPHLLSTSGILLIQKHSHHSDLNDFINSKTNNMMLKKIYEQIGLPSQTFSRSALVKLFDIIQQRVAGKITTTKAVQMLFGLLDEDEDNYDNKVILCFKSLIEQLPTKSFEAKELELTTRLIQPLLQSLFESREENVYLRWTDAQTEEFRRNGSCSNKRPDGCITLVANDSVNLGFIEVKEEKQKNNKAKINKDLWKFGIFSRNAIDQNHLLGVLSIHIVGTSVTFYLTKQQSKLFYTMIEIDHLTAPSNLAELPQLIGFVDNLCNILHVFKTNCRQQ